MKLRPAPPADLLFVGQVECRYYFVEEKGKRGAYVTLRRLRSLDRCLKQKRIVIARRGAVSAVGVYVRS